MQCQFRNRQKNAVFAIPLSETMELLSVFSNHRYELLPVIDLARHSIFFFFTAWVFWLWYFAAATVLRISSPEGCMAVVVCCQVETEKKNLKKKKKS